MSGLGKRLAGIWDAIPVKGRLMTAAVAMVGVVLGLVLGLQPGTTCQDAGGLPEVYKPARLQVIQPLCRTIRFQVVSWRHEHDNDYHVDGVVLSESSQHSSTDASWVNAANVKGQHGYTVVEFVPNLPRPKQFQVGMVLELTGTKVTDHDHPQKVGGATVYWIELHPVTLYTVIR